MKQKIDFAAAGIVDSLGIVRPKFFCGFDGISMRTLNPPGTFKKYETEGSKGNFIIF